MKNMFLFVDRYENNEWITMNLVTGPTKKSLNTINEFYKDWCNYGPDDCHTVLVLQLKSNPLYTYSELIKLFDEYKVEKNENQYYFNNSKETEINKLFNEILTNSTIFELLFKTYEPDYFYFEDPIDGIDYSEPLGFHNLFGNSVYF